MEIKAYQDGGDFVVVFKNCHPSQEKMIKNILSPAMCEDSTLLKEAEEEYKASDYTEDHHNDTESKCLVAVSEFVYQCQGKSADYSGTDG